MKLVRFNQRPFDSLFSDFFNDDFLPSRRMQITSPSVNIKEKESGFSIEVAAPGYKKDDFHVEVDHGVLTISAKVEEKKDESSDKYSLKEFNYSSFKRSFNLPETVEEEKIEANYQDGMLILLLPKQDAAIAKEAKKIAIK